MMHFNKINVILALILVLIGLISLAFSVHSFINTPYLTYEEGYYPLHEGKSLAFIIVKNEGYKTANTVDIRINAKGEIENVMGQKGLIIGEIGEAELFKEYVSFEIIDKSSCKIVIPHIVNGMKYTVCLLIKHGSNDPIGGVIVESTNGGIAEKHTQNGNLFLKNFAMGFIVGTCLTLVVGYLCGKKLKNRLC